MDYRIIDYQKSRIYYHVKFKILDIDIMILFPLNERTKKSVLYGTQYSPVFYTVRY